MCPIFEIKENQKNEPAFNAGAVPTVNPDSNITEVMEAYLGSQVPNKRTARGYRHGCKLFIESQCLERFSDLKTIHLVNWRTELTASSTPSSSSKALIAVRSFLRWACAMGGHDIRRETVEYLLPVPKVTVITPHESLTEREVGRLLEAARAMGHRDYALILVALGAGLRISELVNVDIKDVWDDTGGGTLIHVRNGKGGKDRLMPVRKEVRKAIDDYLKSSARQIGDIGPLFQSEDRAMGSRESWRLTTRSATRIVKAAVERAEIKKRVSPHACGTRSPSHPTSTATTSWPCSTSWATPRWPPPCATLRTSTSCNSGPPSRRSSEGARGPASSLHPRKESRRMPDRRTNPSSWPRWPGERRSHLWERRQHRGRLRILWISVNELLTRLLYFL